MYFFCGLWNLLGINNNYKVVENGCKISEINFFADFFIDFQLNNADENLYKLFGEMSVIQYTRLWAS